MKQDQTKIKAKSEGDKQTMLTRYKAFAGMQRAQVEELIKRDDVQEFLTRAKTAITEKRSITGAELLVPTIMLDLSERFNQQIFQIDFKSKS